MALLEKAIPGLPMVKGKREGQKLHGEEQKRVSWKTVVAKVKTVWLPYVPSGMERPK